MWGHALSASTNKEALRDTLGDKREQATFINIRMGLHLYPLRFLSSLAEGYGCNTTNVLRRREIDVKMLRRSPSFSLLAKGKEATGDRVPTPSHICYVLLLSQQQYFPRYQSISGLNFIHVYS